MAQTAIPSNITSAHIYKAAEEVVASEIPPRRTSYNYDLIVNGHRLPPKYVLGIANKYANGNELDDRTFTAPQAVAFLQKMGFEIERKRDAPTYYSELQRFIQQADADSLKTNGYKKTFAGLEVSVSFGSGNKAKIPWIAFLNEIDEVQNGIYPVYLYYKEHQLLILAYGLSETNEASRVWKLDHPQSITQYFAAHQLGKPARYGSSYVYKVYDISKPLNKDEVDKDLINLIDIYTETEEDAPMPTQKTTTKNITTAFALSAFLDALNATGLIFDHSLVTRLVGSLLTKPFVILTGLSGSGKTKLAQAFVQWICTDAQQYCIIPVGADWTNREPLLGYPNALDQHDYVKPDNGALDLIINANSNPALPYFLILDEMNLSHVERYFADFLSVMESHEAIPLHTGKEKGAVPFTINWPSNLFVVGTVNIDETTNMFSPKVLDRANTIEFRVTAKEMEHFLEKAINVDVKALHAAGAPMALSFMQLSGTNKKSLPPKDAAQINTTLLNFFNELKKAGAEFGYRTASEILILIHQLGAINHALSLNEKIDIAIMQKLLPKLHGSRRKLCPVLVTLGKLCLPNNDNIEKEVFEAESYDYDDKEKIFYPLSLEKITRMYKGAVDNGFASFAEA